MENVYKNGSTQVEFNSSDLEKIHKSWKYVEEKELDSDGIEHSSHCTIRYGCNGGDFQHLYFDVRNYFEQFPIIINGIDFFETKDGDAIHFTVEKSHDIMNLRELIERTMDCIEPQFKEFLPHITICFSKKGLGKEICNRIKSYYIFPFTITAEKLVYSKKDGKRSEIPLKTKAQLATESMMHLLEDFKVPHMAKIIVPKNAKLTDHAIKKHADLLSKNGGKYERHQDGRHIFRVPVIFAKQFYHKLWHTRGINKLKNDPEMSFY